MTWPRRFEGYGWHVEQVADANDLDALRKAYKKFAAVNDRPTTSSCAATSAMAPAQADTDATHGEPLGADEIRLAKESYGWPADAQFLVPEGVRENFQEHLGAHGAQTEPGLGQELRRIREKVPRPGRPLAADAGGELPRVGTASCRSFPPMPRELPAAHLGQALNAVAKHFPWLIGGSADLSPDQDESHQQGRKSFEPGSYGGRNLYFGIREHGMAAALNGMALCHPPVWFDLFGLQRLLPAVNALELDHGAAGPVHLHARQHRRGRRWADASADRASGGAAGDPRHDRHAARRCERSHRSVADYSADQEPSGPR